MLSKEGRRMMTVAVLLILVWVLRRLHLVCFLKWALECPFFMAFLVVVTAQHLGLTLRLLPFASILYIFSFLDGKIRPIFFSFRNPSQYLITACLFHLKGSCSPREAWRNVKCARPHFLKPASLLAHVLLTGSCVLPLASRSLQLRLHYTDLSASRSFSSTSLLSSSMH